MIKNLAEIDFPERLHLAPIADMLFAEAIRAQGVTPVQKAYAFSVPLLIVAQLGDQKRYNQILPAAISAAARLEFRAEYPARAWMLGRILLAADCMADTITFEETRAQLRDLFFVGKPAPDAQTAWAAAYYGGAGKAEYEEIQPALMGLSAQMIGEHREIGQPDLGAALWILVMGMDAASKARNFVHCRGCLRIMQDLSPTAAIPADDFPAWGHSLMRRAAGRMKDADLFASLGDSIAADLQSARTNAYWGDFALGTINNALAKAEFTPPLA